MGFFGKLLALPVKIINIPAETLDVLVDFDSADAPNIAKPLRVMAKVIEKIDD